MTQGIITNAGRDLFAQKQGAGQPLVIDRFLLANISGLDPQVAPNPNEPLPAVGDQVAELSVTQAAYVNADKVVYSLYMGTGLGDFTFNWVGLLADDGTLVAVRYTDPIEKTATAGPVLGNAITRNFLLTYTDAQAITNITVEASTWQLAFDAATESTRGLAEIATQAEADAGVDDTRFITPLKLASRLASFVRNASDSAKGMVELATSIETQAGTDPVRAVTPQGLAARTATESRTGMAEIATYSEAAAGTDDARIVTPLKLKAILDGFSKKGSNDSFASGTKLLFVQAAAPTGWTKITTTDNAALRIVSGSGGGTGGSVDFTSALKSQAVTGSIGSTTVGGSIGSTTAGGSVTVANHTLTESQMPSHQHADKHGLYANNDYYDASHAYGSNGAWASAEAAYKETGGGGAHNHSASFTGSSHSHTFTGSAHSHSFSGTAHSHSFSGTEINLAVKHIDAILCSKD